MDGLDLMTNISLNDVYVKYIFIYPYQHNDMQSINTDGHAEFSQTN